jgi:hypothetical protein
MVSLITGSGIHHGNPATSTDLAASARKLANLFQTIAIDGLASGPSLAAHDAVNGTGITIDGLCK